MQLRVLVEEDGRWHFGAHEVTPPQIDSMAECFRTLLVEFVWNGREPDISDTEDRDAPQLSP